MDDYGEWAKTVPEAITNDMLWKVQAYRLALFAADLGWPDVTKLVNDKRKEEPESYEVTYQTNL